MRSSNYSEKMIPFNQFISQIKKIFPAIVGTISLFITFFFTDIATPQPLTSFEFFGKLFAILALFSAYFYRPKIIKYFRVILIVTIGVTLLFFILYSLLVIKIEYADNTNRLVLTGLSYDKVCILKNDPSVDFTTINEEKLIRDFGYDLDALKCIYLNYVLITIIYKFLFLALISLIITCLGGLIRDTKSTPYEN